MQRLQIAKAWKKNPIRFNKMENYGSRSKIHGKSDSRNKKYGRCAQEKRDYGRWENITTPLKHIKELTCRVTLKETDDHVTDELLPVASM